MTSRNGSDRRGGPSLPEGHSRSMSFATQIGYICIVLPKNKLADTMRPALAEAGLLVRATLALSGLGLLVACVALILVLRRSHAG